MLLENYICYTLYVGDERYPAVNQVLEPFRLFGTNTVDKRGGELKLNFEPVYDIQSRYVDWGFRSDVKVIYDYWLDEVDYSNKKKDCHYGILFFSEDALDKIAIGILRKDTKTSHSFSPESGYDIIVAGKNKDEAKETFEMLGLTLEN